MDDNEDTTPPQRLIVPLSHQDSASSDLSSPAFSHADTRGLSKSGYQYSYSSTISSARSRNRRKYGKATILGIPGVAANKAYDGHQPPSSMRDNDNDKVDAEHERRLKLEHRSTSVVWKVSGSIDWFTSMVVSSRLPEAFSLDPDDSYPSEELLANDGMLLQVERQMKDQDRPANFVPKAEFSIIGSTEGIVDDAGDMRPFHTVSFRCACDTIIMHRVETWRHREASIGVTKSKIARPIQVRVENI